MDEACTNANDQMMLVQHYSGDRVMSWRGFGRIFSEQRQLIDCQHEGGRQESER